jgi:hydrogenase maturation factor
MTGRPSVDRCETEGHCVTCSDEGVPMLVVSAAEPGLAVCEDETGARTDVMTDLVGAVEPGDVVLVHAGVALTPLTDPEEFR